MIARVIDEGACLSHPGPLEGEDSQIGRRSRAHRRARPQRSAAADMRTVYARHYGMRLHCSEAYYLVTPTVQLHTTVWDRLLSARGDAWSVDVRRRGAGARP